MILNFPSGFYRTILPPASGNQGNVTFTISNNAPPRGALFFLKIDNNLARTSPSLLPSEPQGDINSSTLRAFRNVSIIDREPRPIGSVLEFNDQYKTIQGERNSLDQTVDFPRFNSGDVNAANPRLKEAYEVTQRSLLQISSSSLTKQSEIENLERLTNTLIASLEATEAALAVFPGDTSLTATLDNLNSQISINQTQIDLLKSEIVVLDDQRLQAEERIRQLSKVIT